MQDNKVRIGSIEVPVSVDPNIDEGTLGEWCMLHETIKLNPLLRPKQRAPVVFHECLHALSDLYGIELEERQVRALEQLVPALLRANARLTLALLGISADRNEEVAA